MAESLTETPDVLVLAGERNLPLRAAGLTTREETIDLPTPAELAAMPGRVVFPVLHGPFGEGGPLQDRLEIAGRPYVGARPVAARLAMDKIASKSVAATLGVAVTPTALFSAADETCPLPLPVVIKPVREGSTVGLFVCRTRADYARAFGETAAADRPAMIEPFIAGREITAGVLLGAPLPLIEIRPAGGLYDYAAKYERDDTAYLVAPPLPPGLTEAIQSQAAALARAIGASDLARVDFMLDGAGTPWLLEINTMPGFTDHSLVPMAARAAGLEMPELCARLAASARPAGTLRAREEVSA